MLHNFSLCLKQKLNDLLDFSGNFGKVLIVYELDCAEKCSKNDMALKFQNVPYLIKTHRLFYPHEIINISSNIFPLVEKQKQLNSPPILQCSPVKPEGHKQRYFLSVNPDWQRALLWQ